MAIPNINKCAMVRAPANIIRQQWAGKIQSWQSKNNATVDGSSYRSFLRYSNFAEYNAGYSYIYKNSSGAISSVINTDDNNSIYSGYWYTFPSLKYNTISDSAPDISDIKNLIGFLSVETVGEYCARHNFTTASRLFMWNNATTNNRGLIFDSATQTPVDDLARFSDWLVPLITWYYTDADGDRRSWDDTIAIYYFYSSTSVVYTQEEIHGAGGSNYRDYRPKTLNYNGNRYMAFSPPYCPANDVAYSAVKEGAFYSGYMWTSYAPLPSDNIPRVYIQGAENPYVILYPNAGKPTINPSTPFITGVMNLGYNVLSNTYRISSQVFGTNYSGSGFPAYKSVDDIINYFADFGVKLTTDLNDAIIPTDPTEPEINPDNPNEPIPSYPDNTTDETPIDPTYITPSTFGKSLVYNPLSTNQFLEWISDSSVNIDNWRRLFANPADVIHGINIFNLDIVQHDSSRVAQQAKTNILGVETDIPNYAILDGYNNIIDGGSITLQAYYGNYADFTSMTYQIYIPFVGFTSLRACDVVNKTLHLYYAVDFMTGAAVVFLNSDNKLIYTSPCTVCGKIPLSTSDKNSQILNNTMSALGGIGGLLAGVATGNIAGGVSSAIGGVTGMQLQTNYTNHGSMSGVNIFRLIPAFIERTRYDLFLPSGEQEYLGSKYQSWAGAPSTQFATLRECADEKGYCQSDYAVLPTCAATENEKNEIRALIQNGVFIS